MFAKSSISRKQIHVFFSRKLILLILTILLSAIHSALFAQTPGNIYTIAGNGAYSSSGDGGLATNATLYAPTSVALDAAGNVYIADTDGWRVRKITATTGIISTVAGNGTYGDTGDGGPATSAELGAPGPIALDSAGNLYISTLSYVTGTVQFGGIRKVTASTGIISTILVGGNAAISGIAVDLSGNVYFSDGYANVGELVASNGNIIAIAGNGTQGYSGDGGAATSSSLWQPLQIALDNSGNLYIADAGNLVIRKVNLSTGIITTIAGNNSISGYSGDGGLATAAGIGSPFGVAIDSAGNLYLADEHDNVIRKVNAVTQIIETVAGGVGQGYNGDNIVATSAELSIPYSIAVDGIGNFYVADEGNNRVRKVYGARLSPSIVLSTPNTTVSANSTTAVTATATGAGATPTGTVTITEASGANGSYSSGPLTLIGGAASFTPNPTIYLGNNVFNCTYSGDPNYVSGACNTLTIVGAVNNGQIVFSPTPVTFASTAVGSSSAPQTITVTNDTGQNLTGFALTSTDATDFSLTSNTCPSSFAWGASCTFVLTFTPTVAGTATETVTGAGNSSGGPYSGTLPVSGLGVAPNPSYAITLIQTSDYTPGHIFESFTVTTTNSTPLIGGQSIVISGNSNSFYNNYWTIDSIIDSTHFKVVQEIIGTVVGGGGIATVQ